jgi:hypothetical protein
MPQGVAGMALSDLLARVMLVANTAKLLETHVQDLINEIQTLIVTKAEAKEIKLEDPDD